MFPLIETALAFATAMLAASLFVSAAVQILQKLGRYRSRTVREMLEALMHGFRAYQNDADILADENKKDSTREATFKKSKEAEETFAEDILSDPTLHTRAQKLKYRDNTEQLAKLVEYIDEKDLITLAVNHSEYYDSPSSPPKVDTMLPAQVDAIKLPVEWVGGAKPYATIGNFKRYVGRLFKTLEGTAAESFKMRIRRLTVIISVTLVVLFNLDGFDLLKVLYYDGGGRTALIQQIDTLGTTAGRLGVNGTDSGSSTGPDAGSDVDTDNTRKQLLLELQKTATILDEADIGIGWQKSWIVKRWAAYKGVGDGSDIPPSTSRIVLDSFRWLGGLLFSCVMLSLGAPFWYGALSKMINIKNQVQQYKQNGTAEKAKGLEETAAAAAAGAAAAVVVGTQLKTKPESPPAS